MLSALLDRCRGNDPVPVYLLLAAGQSVCFSLFFTVQLIYHVTVVGLDPFRMVLVGAVLEIPCVLFEIPTGVVADVHSRLSILVGTDLMGCGYALEGPIPAFWAALLSQVSWGIGSAFNSGANQARITDEIGDEAVGPVFLRGGQTWLIGGLVGTLLSVALGVVHIQLPMVLAGVGMLALAGALALLMPERPVRPLPSAARSPFGAMRATAREGFRAAMDRPVVKVIIAISLITGLAAEAWDRLHVPAVIDRFAFPTLFGTESPVIWFGISGVIATLLGLAASEIFGRKNPASLGAGAPARLLAALTAVDAAAVVLFALGGNFWLAFATLWVRRIVGAIGAPVQAARLSRSLDSATRATVISMTGQANSLGWVGGAVTIRAALLGSALVLSPSIALYRRLIACDRGAAEPVPPPGRLRSVRSRGRASTGGKA